MVKVTRKRAEELLHSSEYSPRELANLLDTSQEHLFNEVWHGRLRAVQVGKDIVSFERADVLDWLEHRRQAHG